MSGRKADVIKAAHLCAEAALRLVKPGNQVNDRGVWKHSSDGARSSGRLYHTAALGIKMKAWEARPSSVGSWKQLSAGSAPGGAPAPGWGLLCQQLWLLAGPECSLV